MLTFRTFKLDAHRASALAVFVLSTLIYMLTMAPSLSFWDVGEFVTVSDILGVSHPPGAPLFILVMHILSMLPLSADIAVRCTYLAVLTGGFSIMLAYLIIVRLLRHFRGHEESLTDKIILYGGGIIGALSLAWSYSMWFNSVEAILFTPSLFCTALCVWLALVWYEKADEPGSARYLLLIAFIIGLAIGVHLLSVLSIPAIMLIIHFRYKKLALGSLIGWLIVSIIVTFLVYPGVVKFVPALASHLGFVALIVLLALLVYLFYRAVKRQHGLIGVIIAAATLILVGASTYTYIYIRAGENPAINENNPGNPARFFSYMNREQYGSRPFFPRYWNNNPAYHSASDFFWRYQVNKMYLRYLWWQFIGRQGAPEREYQDAGVTPNYTVLHFLTANPTGIVRLLALLTCIPFILGLIGLVYQYMKDKPGWIIVITLFFMTGLAIVLYLNQEDPQPRERDYSYVGSFFAFAIWIGIGAAAVIEWATRKLKTLSQPGAALVAASALFLLSPLMLLGQNYSMDSRRGNYAAEDYTYSMLASCPQNAILITNGDNDTFPVWYMQQVKHFRKDIRIVNLSLVNTGWYIKQLKHDEPRVPISFTDSYIDRYLDATDTEALLARYWPPAKQKLELNTPEGKMEWTMPASMYIPIQDAPDAKQAPNFLRVQDIMVLDILRTNFDPAKNPVPKPICFAVTVPSSNMIGLREYLTMTGLVFNLNPRGGESLDPVALEHNILEVYDHHLRGIADPHVHFDDNVDRLLANYRSAYLQLAYYYMMQPGGDVVPASTGSAMPDLATFDKLSNRQKALALLDDMERKIPEAVRPIYNPELEVQIGSMYAQLGREDELRNRLIRLGKDETLPIQSKALLAATWYSTLHDTARGDSLLNAALGQSPTRDALYDAGIELASAHAYAPAEKYLERVLAMDPDDGEAVGALLQVYNVANDAAKARTLLSSWIARHPSDKGATSRLKALSPDSAHPAAPPDTSRDHG